MATSSVNRTYPFWTSHFRLCGQHMNKSGHIMHQSGSKPLIAAYGGRLVSLDGTLLSAGIRRERGNTSKALSSFLTCEVYSAGFGHLMSEISHGNAFCCRLSRLAFSYIRKCIMMKCASSQKELCRLS